jgi:hypothetical protein
VNVLLFSVCFFWREWCDEFLYFALLSSKQKGVVFCDLDKRKTSFLCTYSLHSQMVDLLTFIVSKPINNLICEMKILSLFYANIDRWMNQEKWREREVWNFFLLILCLILHSKIERTALFDPLNVICMKRTYLIICILRWNVKVTQSRLKCCLVSYKIRRVEKRLRWRKIFSHNHFIEKTTNSLLPITSSCKCLWIFTTLNNNIINIMIIIQSSL